MLEKQVDLPKDDLDRDDLLNLLVSTVIEPQFDPDVLTCLYHYPKTQAALACLKREDGNIVAERFEIYSGSLELANGYHEAQSSEELRGRFEKSNQERKKLGKESYPLDENFLKSNSQLPACSGVAVGFDRLLMLHLRVASIDDTHPIPWELA